MKTLVIATKNEGKFKEFSELLRGLAYNILYLKDYPDIEIVEDGDTFEENAVKKAKAVVQHTGHITLADDSGLKVDALGGKPGVHTARFAGDNATDVDNLQKLLRDMKDVPWELRRAQFVCCLAIAYPGGKVTVEKGVLEGFINFEPKGSQGFGYDPVFFLPERHTTLAVLGQEYKNQISHRARAFEKIRRYLT